MKYEKLHKCAHKFQEIEINKYFKPVGKVVREADIVGCNITVVWGGARLSESK